ncbi:hypothetical protein SOVF_017880 [Spinacia oleracea]|nr:hypothetical protein SOVF_017880 [Spinacia oleracea]
MGRAKIAMEFISKEKLRNTTYAKRKKGLLKKGHEFSILCNVPVCIIIYPYNEGKKKKQSTEQPEVYSFKGDSLDLGRATDPNIAKEIIDRYLSVPNDEKFKRSLNLYDMVDDWKRKEEQELLKLRQKNGLISKYPNPYPSWDSRFDGLTSDQLVEFLAHLDSKIEFVRQRIALIKSNSSSNNNISNDVDVDVDVEKAGLLVPYYDHEPTQSPSPSPIPTPTPISSVMSGHQIMGGYPYIEGYNQLYSSYNYPINNSNNYYYNNQQYCHQLVPFNYPNNDHYYQGGVATLMGDDHDGGGGGGGGGGKGSNLMYNMNTMYYDQGRGIVDNVGAATSSYGAGLPMQSLPMLQPNASLSMQRQYQMFYNSTSRYACEGSTSSHI